MDFMSGQSMPNHITYELSTCYLAMVELDQLSPFALLLSSLVLFFLTLKVFCSSSAKSSSGLPKSYPIVGSYFSLRNHKHDVLDWISNILQSSPSATFTLHRGPGDWQVVTANPANVEHILKTQFPIYQKGTTFNSAIHDLLGHGIFNVDGAEWKFQRQVASHEFNTKSLRKFVEQVVDAEVTERLIPVLSDAAKKGTVLDLQDILKRFAFDNICKIGFGYDPEYLIPSLPEAPFAVAFEEAVEISSLRFRSFSPLSWKIRRFLNIGAERNLKKAVSEVREFARTLVRQKKKELETESHQEGNSLPESNLDLLSRFLKSGHADENFVTDIVISFILAGRDTTSAALTWFFFLLSRNRNVEEEIRKELSSSADSESSVFDEVRQMVYTHASLCESMRLYPPVPADSKEAVADDVLPDGTAVKKGMRVTYHPYAMGRSEKLWGKDWAEFKPERWLEKETTEEGKWRFVGRDPYSYPVFQAGPRICLGKEMAFLQMKRIVAGILTRFRVVPAVEDGLDPTFVPSLTAKMHGGFSVRLEEKAL